MSDKDKKDKEENDEEEEDEEEEEEEEEKELPNEKEILQTPTKANENNDQKEKKYSTITDTELNTTKKNETMENTSNKIAYVSKTVKKEKEESQTINTEMQSKRTFRNYTRCVRCGKSKVKNPITFTCNHITCFNCLIKDLTLSQFKNIENKKSTIFRCACNIGNASIPFEDFKKELIKVNTPVAPRRWLQGNAGNIKKLEINIVVTVNCGYVINA